MGSFATRYSHEAGKQRDELARGRETIGHLAAIIADVPVPQPTLCLDHIRILGDELLPEFTHHPLNVLRLVMIAVGTLVTKLTQAENARMRIAGMGNEGGLGRLVNDALRRDVELIAGD